MISSDDGFVKQELQNGMYLGPPDPSWKGALSRAGRANSRHKRTLVAAFALLFVLVAVLPALAYDQHILIFSSATRAPSPIVEEFATLDRGAPLGLDNHAIASETRRVSGLTLTDGSTSNVWVSPTEQGGFCIEVERFIGPACMTTRSTSLALGVDFAGVGKPVVIAGGSISSDAATVRVEYQDGTVSSFSGIYVTAPIDAFTFAFELPPGHLVSGAYPTRLVLLSNSGDEVAASDLTDSFRLIPGQPSPYK
jgi:hypothetical protein